MANTTAVPSAIATFAEADGQKNFSPRVDPGAHRMSPTAFAANQQCYGTNPVQNRNTFKGAPRSTADEGQYLTGSGSKIPNFKRSWKGVIEISCNVLATGGFVVGSVLWRLGKPINGAYVFALSCLFCAISCLVYTAKFYLADNIIGAYALLQRMIGCILFITASCAYLTSPRYFREALNECLAASIVFLTGSLLTQVQCRSWCGVLAPLYPQARIRCLPTSLCNSLGSACFVAGSVCLYYYLLVSSGFYLYIIGSILFFIASWGDATVWWTTGCTQSEHQDVTKFEAGYASVEYL